MVRRPKEVPVVQVHHERYQYLTVLPEHVEGQMQRLPKGVYSPEFRGQAYIRLHLEENLKVPETSRCLSNMMVLVNRGRHV